MSDSRYEIGSLKLIDNFLPPRVFDRLLKIVESNSLTWVWNNDSHIHTVTKQGDNHWMFSQLLFIGSGIFGYLHSSTEYFQNGVLYRC